MTFVSRIIVVLDAMMEVGMGFWRVSLRCFYY